jgi:nicotinate phosphoribosyltransferase
MSHDKDEPPQGCELKGTDLLAEAMKLREELGWTGTNLQELHAFTAYAFSHPTNFLCLADTFHTIESGTKNFLILAVILHRLGYEPKGIRLDSGDLAELSKQARKLFAETGARFGIDFSGLHVVASNDINEKTICELNEAGHEISIFGIGTNLVTCQAQPALGMVYKLVEKSGKPRLKLSESRAKASIPGFKRAYRIYSESRPEFDILLNSEEPDLEAGPVTGYDSLTGDSVTVTATKVGRLSTLLFDGEPKVEHHQPIEGRRASVIGALAGFDQEVVGAETRDYQVLLSERVWQELERLLKEVI